MGEDPIRYMCADFNAVLDPTRDSYNPLRPINTSFRDQLLRETLVELDMTDTATLIQDRNPHEHWTYAQHVSRDDRDWTLKRLDAIWASSLLGVTDVKIDPGFIDKTHLDMDENLYGSLSDHSPVTVSVNVSMWECAFAPEMYDLCYWLADAIQYRAPLLSNNFYYITALSVLIIIFSYSIPLQLQH